MQDNNITTLSGGLNLDSSPLLQPEGTYRYALNAVNQTLDGNVNVLSNEASVEIVDGLPNGYIIIGSVNISNNKTVVFLTYDGVSEIGVFDDRNKYTTYINTRSLNFSEKYPITATYRSKNNERIIYFVDAINKPRCVNIDRLEDYYTDEYKQWLESSNSDFVFSGSKWNILSFNLIKSYSDIPVFNNVEILSNGSIVPGSYSFGIMYVDNDGNSTNVITTSNSVNIYNDSLNKDFGTIRGSMNVASTIMSYGVTNKSIKVSVGNLDTNYPFYRVIVIQANAMTGKSNKALLSEILSINQSDYVYYGNDESLVEIPLESILIDKLDIDNAEFITQLENRLILGKYKTKNVNFADFQKYASKIRSHLTNRKVYINSVNSPGNSKNPLSSFETIGYLPGEVYSFGIVYIFNDGTLSPAYHIPGRNKNELRESINGFNDNMDYYENPNSKYPEIHKKIGRNNYWGVDSYGSYLTGTAKRHHKFPSRKSRNIPLYGVESSSVNIYKYKLNLTISLKSGKTYPLNSITNEPLIIDCIVKYKKLNTNSYNSYSTLLTSNVSKETFEASVYSGFIELEELDNNVFGQFEGEILNYSNYFNIYIEYRTEVVETLNPAYYTNIFGIAFDNIERPHPDIIGYYIVRNERFDSDKIIVDKAIFGPLSSYNFGTIHYKVFNKWTHKNTIADKAIYFFNPQFQFNHKDTTFSHIEIEGFYDLDITTSHNNGEPADTTGDYDINQYGVVISDTMDGTSFNPDVHAGSDDDGFNLLIGYRNSNVSYNADVPEVDWSVDDNGESDIDNIFYLGAANSKLYNGDTYYNATTDNKIGIIKFNNTISTSIFNGGTRLLYGSLVNNNETAYSNFLDRNYYKEHNNHVLFNSDGTSNRIEIYNGDSFVNAITPISSSYFGMIMADRKKKDKKSSGILGVGLIIIGVVATIFTAGAAIGIFSAIGTTSALVLSTVGMMAISAGASMYGSYLELENLKKMIADDYPKGLQDAIKDSDMTDSDKCNLEYGTNFSADNLAEVLSNNGGVADDCIVWFADRVTDIIMESDVNFGLRTSLTSLGVDFINSLSKTGYDIDEFRAYLTEKLTIIDAERGDGRLYRGYANTEWYHVNPDFNKRNDDKIFIHLPINYDSYSTNNDYSEKYNNRLLYSQQSFQEEEIDNYRCFLSNNYRDLDSSYGSITNLFTMGNNLYVHTEEGLWKVPQNLQERVTSELSTYIGTGEFLGITPLKIASGFTNYGSQNKASTTYVKNGIAFINEMTKEIFVLSNDKIDNISDINMTNWFKNNIPSSFKDQLYDLPDNKWKVSNPYTGYGLISAYDPVLSRLLITKKDYEFVNVEDYKGEFSYENTNYQPGDIYVLDDVCYYVNEAFYKELKDINFLNFEENKSILISNIDVVVNSGITFNFEGRWFNKTSSTYTVIDYESDNYITTNTKEINWSSLLSDRPKYLNSNYINAYFTSTFKPFITKTYNFYIESNNGSKLYIDKIEIINNVEVITNVLTINNWSNTSENSSYMSSSVQLDSNYLYRARIEYYQGSGDGAIKFGIVNKTTQGGSITKNNTGYITYIPPLNFEGEDSFEVITDKSTYSKTPETVVVIVKDVDGSTEQLPYDLEKITSYDYPIYREIYNFPLIDDGIFVIQDKISVPHRYIVKYTDDQTFIIDNSTFWREGNYQEYGRNITHVTGVDTIKVTVEATWRDPYDNSEYERIIDYKFDFILS